MNTMKSGATFRKKALEELKQYWLTVLYMAMFFGVFANFQRLVLAQYQIVYTDYGFAVIEALVLAKVILVAEALGLGRRFEDRPLIVPILYKTVLFTICAGVFDVIESMVLSFVHGSDFSTVVQKLRDQYDLLWVARALVVFFSFIPFFTVREFSRVFGRGTMSTLLLKGTAALRSDVGRMRSTGDIDPTRDVNEREKN